jgi:hypothetical protein
MKIRNLFAALFLLAGCAAAEDSDIFLPEIEKLDRPVKNFMDADVNRNGQVTRDEFMAQRALWAKQKGSPHDEKQSEQIFLNKDRNKDGELTPEEYKAR